MAYLPSTTSIGTIIQYAAMASTATQGASTLTSSSNTQAIALAQSFANMMSSVANDANSNLLYNAASSIVQTLNNVLSASYQEQASTNTSALASSIVALTKTIQRSQSSALTTAINTVANGLLSTKVPDEEATIVNNALAV